MIKKHAKSQNLCTEAKYNEFKFREFYQPLKKRHTHKCTNTNVYITKREITRDAKVSRVWTRQSPFKYQFYLIWKIEVDSFSFWFSFLSISLSLFLVCNFNSDDKTLVQHSIKKFMFIQQTVQISNLLFPIAPYNAMCMLTLPYWSDGSVCELSTAYLPSACVYMSFYSTSPKHILTFEYKRIVQLNYTKFGRKIHPQRYLI